jgi:hypothetical protein
VKPGSTINLIAVWNKHAGQAAIANVKKDKFGNAAGNQFDLGVDGAFVGLKVCLIDTTVLVSASSE